MLFNTLQSLLITAGAFVAVLSLVVFVHEFGHFQAARWCKVAIDTFSIGFGKALARWRDKQGVAWKVGVLPLGGYVKFVDDADAMSTGPRERIEDPAAFLEARRKGLFHAQPLASRAIVVAAGPIANFIFAILAFAFVVMVVGRDVTDGTKLPARVGLVAPNSAAATAGLRAGDVIVGVDSETISSFGQLQEAVSGAPERALHLSVQRDGSLLSLTATPSAKERRGADGVMKRIGMLGVGQSVLPDEVKIERVGPVQALGYGAAQSWDIVARTFGYVADVITRKESGDQIAGPLGIMKASGQIAEAALAASPTGNKPPLQDRLGRLALSLLQFAAILSVAVGIVNLLPIPILDGGHLVFYAIEGVRGGRPLPPAAQEWAYRAGFAVLAGLFLFATWNDVTRHLMGS
jgi:regulator of sigma E protease